MMVRMKIRIVYQNELDAGSFDTAGEAVGFFVDCIKARALLRANEELLFEYSTSTKTEVRAYKVDDGRRLYATAIIDFKGARNE